VLIDSHAHIDGEAFDLDREEILENARQAGVDMIVQVGYSRETIARGFELFSNEPMIRFSVGVHPHEASAYDEAYLDYVETASLDKKVVAIGECGLDFFRDYAPQAVQEKCFRDMIRLARRRGLPLIIHSRAAQERTMAILREENAASIGGVMHCYAYDAECARELAGMNFLISFPCFVTYKKNNQHDTIAALQVEQMLVETDAPFLPPQRIRGKRNEPANVVEVAKTIAAIKGLSYADVARITTRNARRLFGQDLNEDIVFTYPIRDSLYINLTNRCTADCYFCSRLSDPVVKGHNLKMRRNEEPDLEELIKSIEDRGGVSAWSEFVFCGYGEPLMRINQVRDLGHWIKNQGGKVRVNTNGHADMWLKRKTSVEIADAVDVLSISLNADNAVQYNEIVKPAWGEATFQGLLEYIQDAVIHLKKVVLTVVDDGKINIDGCRQIADDLGAELRVRSLNETG
jgi:TatD DNase family protein